MGAYISPFAAYVSAYSVKPAKFHAVVPKHGIAHVTYGPCLMLCCALAPFMLHLPTEGPF